MEPLLRLSSVVAPLLRDNIDTDAIIPAAYMRSLSTDPGSGLFARWRYRADGSPEPDFVLNDPRFAAARILIAGANFGCGSSRENAVWALDRFGIRCVVALGFSDIFRENAFKNGLLPIALRRARASPTRTRRDEWRTTCHRGCRAKAHRAPVGRSSPFRSRRAQTSAPAVRR